MSSSCSSLQKSAGMGTGRRDRRTTVKRVVERIAPRDTPPRSSVFASRDNRETVFILRGPSDTIRLRAIKLHVRVVRTAGRQSTWSLTENALNKSTVAAVRLLRRRLRTHRNDSQRPSSFNNPNMMNHSASFSPRSQTSYSHFSRLFQNNGGAVRQLRGHRKSSSHPKDRDCLLRFCFGACFKYEPLSVQFKPRFHGNLNRRAMHRHQTRSVVLKLKLE